MDIQQPATLAESRKAPIVVGSGDWLDAIVCDDNVRVLSGLPDACIDLTVTSPPYDDIFAYGGHSWDFNALAAQLARVTKPGGIGFEIKVHQGKRLNQIVAETFGAFSKPHGTDWLMRHLRKKLVVRWAH